MTQYSCPKYQPCYYLINDVYFENSITPYNPMHFQGANSSCNQLVTNYNLLINPLINAQNPQTPHCGWHGWAYFMIFSVVQQWEHFIERYTLDKAMAQLESLDTQTPHCGWHGWVYFMINFRYIFDKAMAQLESLVSNYMWGHVQIVMLFPSFCIIYWKSLQ